MFPGARLPSEVVFSLPCLLKVVMLYSYLYCCSYLDLLNICHPLKEILKRDHLNEQYFPVFLFIMLLRSGLTFECVDEILKYHHSNESYLAILFGGIVNNTVQGGSYLFYLWKKP